MVFCSVFPCLKSVSQCTEPRYFLVTKLMCAWSWKKTSKGSVIYCPLPGVSAISAWNQVTCITPVRHTVLSCFSYTQLPGLQGDVRAEELSGRGWLALSALNRLSSKQESTPASKKAPGSPSFPPLPSPSGRESEELK